MNFTPLIDPVDKQGFEKKNIGHNLDRVVFRCPDDKWLLWWSQYELGQTKYEPFPYNHYIWSQK